MRITTQFGTIHATPTNFTKPNMNVTQLSEPELFVYHVNHNGSHYVMAENSLHALKLYANHINADITDFDTMQVTLNFIPRHIWDNVRTRNGRLDLLISERGQFAGVLT